jgi:hypothetical protein
MKEFFLILFFAKSIVVTPGPINQSASHVVDGSWLAGWHFGSGPALPFLDDAGAQDAVFDIEGMVLH